MFRTVERQGGKAEEVFLVLDASTGQNAVQQAKLFSEVAPLTGLILTKLDGSAKGGVVFQLASEAKVPVRYVGVGEKPEDLIDFDAEAFVDAILSGASE
jgi:fused signal recognition particle receptor